MSQLSEKEIIENIKISLNTYIAYGGCIVDKDALRGLLDLYNKEKEKNKQLFEEYNKRVSTIIKYEQTIKTAIDEFEDVLEE